MTVQEADQIVRRNFTRAWPDIVGQDPSYHELKKCYAGGHLLTMKDVLYLLKGWR